MPIVSRYEVLSSKLNQSEVTTHCQSLPTVPKYSFSLGELYNDKEVHQGHFGVWDGQGRSVGGGGQGHVAPPPGNLGGAPGF